MTYTQSSAKRRRELLSISKELSRGAVIRDRTEGGVRMTGTLR
jgi:hypothetical protein